MRTLLKVRVPAEQGSRAIRDGSMTRLLESTAQLIRPEASYFTAEDGCRTAYFVFDLKDSSQVPAIAEPFFNTFNAEINLSPVMNWEDLKEGLSKLRER